jgi:histidine triad (HIT) family protein
MSDCIFCKIIDGKIPSARVYEDESVIAIRDIQPQSKTHILVIPKRHFTSIAEAYADVSTGAAVASQLFTAAHRIALQEKLLPNGYRSVINTGEDGGQTVHHLHLHLLGGEKLKGRFA